MTWFRSWAPAIMSFFYLQVNLYWMFRLAALDFSDALEAARELVFTFCLCHPLHVCTVEACPFVYPRTSWSITTNPNFGGLIDDEGRRVHLTFDYHVWILSLGCDNTVTDKGYRRLTVHVLHLLSSRVLLRCDAFCQLWRKFAVGGYWLPLYTRRKLFQLFRLISSYRIMLDMSLFGAVGK